MRGLLSLVLALFAGSVAPFGAGAQDAADPEVDPVGVVTGIVVEAETGDPLPGANVTIEGTSRGTTTDLNGRYRLKELKPGTYDLIFSFVGFQRKTVQGVEVAAGETTTLDVSLWEETAQLDEVVVSAEVARNSEAGLLKDRQKAAAVSNAISAERISQSGAGDAAEAMKQVTGASVVDGKYVLVRGLGGRYAATQLNGVSMPSSDPDANSVQFDLFPSELLKNVTTVKTFTPDRPGDFSGGLTNINTRSFPSEFNFTFSSSVSVNAETHFEDDFLTYRGGDTDWLGFDDGSRSLPDALQGLSPDEVPDRPAFISSEEDAERFSKMSKAFNNVMGPTARSTPLNQSYSLSLGNQSDVGGRPLGYIMSLSYDRSSSFYEGGTTGRFELSGNRDELSELILLDDEKSQETATVSGLANFTYQLTPNHEVGLNTTYNHTGESSTRLQAGRWTEVGAQDTLRNRTILWKERDVLSTQLRGKSYFEAMGDAVLEWDASYARTTQEEPDRRFFASVAFDQGDRGTLRQAFDQGLRPPQRLFRDLEETKYTAKLDLTVPLSLGGREGNVKVGGVYNTTDRIFSERQFSFNEPEFGSGVEFDGDANSFFSDQNVGIVDEGQFGPVWGLTIDDQTGEFNSYDGDRTVGAGYAMATIPVSERFRVIGGVRLESTDFNVRATPDSVGGFDVADLLPSLNLVYEATENMNVRAAATRTVARPSFREIAPFPSFNFVQGELIIGNPDLDRTVISNLDLRWEWFPHGGEVLAASIYYKRMDDPIERAFIGSSSNTGQQLTWKNVDQADVYGAEIEFRKRLDVLGRAFRHFSIGGNASFTESQIDVPCIQFSEDGEECIRGELLFRQINDEPSTRDLQGQSPFLVNLNMSYDNPDTGTSVGLFYNVFGERLSVVSTGSTPDVFEEPRPQVDFTFSQELLSHWSLSLDVENILNSNSEQTYSFKGQEFTYQENELGRTFSMGLSYKIR
jgi:outer membrane receptor protein involved in Fe transport